MKIFLVHEDPWHAGNPYIFTLIEGLRKQHPECELSWGREEFWSDNILSFDIVHFQWPQTFMGKDSHTEEDLLHHINKMKSVGVKVVATCHDLEPHYGQFADKAGSMKIVYSHCDAIIHLGEYSKSLFEARYPNAVHLLIPHHLYDTVYRNFPSKKESLEYLHLPEEYTYILCFGTFRSEEERQLVISLCKQLNDKKLIVLAPGFMDIGWRSVKVIFQKIKKAYYEHKYRIYCTGRTWKSVDDQSLPYYYGVADVVFIQRLKILNSGNAVMPMLFGKVVVGPDCGNVGPLLRRWNYPIFDVGNTSEISNVVREAIRQSGARDDKRMNRQFAEYATGVIVDKLFEAYGQIFTLS